MVGHLSRPKANGLRLFIQSNRDDGATDEAIVSKLQKYYFLEKLKHGKLCKPRHHPKYSRTAKAFPVFAK